MAKENAGKYTFEIFKNPPDIKPDAAERLPNHLETELLSSLSRQITGILPILYPALKHHEFSLLNPAMVIIL